MSETNLMKQSLNWQEVACELQEFFESVLEQSQFTPEQQAALSEQLKGSVESRDKLGNVLLWMGGQARLLREKETQLAERRQRIEKLSAALRSSLHQQMLDWGIKKVEGNEYSFSVKKNPPRVEIVDEEAIPPEFIDYTPSVNKTAIKSALEDGKQVVQSTRLDIR